MYLKHIYKNSYQYVFVKVFKMLDGVQEVSLRSPTVSGLSLGICMPPVLSCSAVFSLGLKTFKS